MINRGRTQSFLKRYDSYAKNVTLTYKKSGSFPTTCGGITSICSSILLIYWFAVNFAYAFIDYGSYSTSFSTVLTQEADSSYPLYEMEEYDFFVANRLVSISGKKEAETKRHIGAVYIQTTDDPDTKDGTGVEKVYPAKLCNEVFANE